MLTAILKTFFSLVQKEGGFPGGSDGKESACNVVDLDLIPRLGRSPEEGDSYLYQYSGPENSMDCIVQRVGHD